MIFDWIKVLLDGAALIIAVAGLGFTWFRTRSSQVDRNFKAGSERMDRLDGRLTRLEQTVAAMPTKDDLHNIELAMGKIDGRLAGMEAIMTRLETIVTRHENHLLSK